MATKTFMPRIQDIERSWFVVDAEGLTLGRLATRVASLLRGKHKPIYVPHQDVGDHVIVINAEKVRLDRSQGRSEVVLSPLWISWRFPDNRISGHAGEASGTHRREGHSRDGPAHESGAAPTRQAACVCRIKPPACRTATDSA